MAEFEVYVASLRQYIPRLEEMGTNLQNLNLQLLQCMQNLMESFSETANVQMRLEENIGYLCSTAGQVGQMAESLAIICGRYEYYEEQAVGSAQNVSSVSARAGGEYGEFLDSLVKSETNSKTEFESKMELKDILSFLGKLTKEINGDDDNAHAKTLSSFLSTYASGLKLGESISVAEWYTAFVGFSGSTIGFGSKLGTSIRELAQKYGTSSVKAWFAKNEKTVSSEMKELGTIGSAAGFASSYLKAIQDSDSLAEFLKNSSGWLTSGKDLVIKLNELDTDFDKATGKPAAELLSMASYLAGDIIDLSTDGHPITTNETSDLLLKTGLTGLNSVVPVVDIDIDNSMEFFNKNIKWTSDKIYSLNIPTSGKVALGIAASPVVAAWSVGETIYDFGYHIGKGIKNFFIERN